MLAIFTVTKTSLTGNLMKTAIEGLRGHLCKQIQYGFTPNLWKVNPCFFCHNKFEESYVIRSILLLLYIGFKTSLAKN